MLRLAAAAALTAGLLATPALAQVMQPETYTPEEAAAANAAVAAAGLPEKTHQDLWCALAFTMFSDFLKAEGQTEQAVEATGFAAVLFDKVNPVIEGLTLSDEQKTALPGQMRVVVVSQENAEFSQEQCTAAVQAD